MWKNRILGAADVLPTSLMANPLSWRVHTPYQHECVENSLAAVGWVRPVIVNDTTGHLIDGHLRVMVALGHAQKAKMPVLYVELTADEERAVLSALDPISTLARIDHDRISLNGSLTHCVCPSCGSQHFKPKED